MRHANRSQQPLSSFSRVKLFWWVIIAVGVLVTVCNLCIYIYYVTTSTEDESAALVPSPIAGSARGGGGDADAHVGDDGGGGLSDNTGDISDNNGIKKNVPHDPHNMVFHQQDDPKTSKPAGKHHHHQKKGAAAADAVVGKKDAGVAAAKAAGGGGHHHNHKGKVAVADIKKAHHAQDDEVVGDKTDITAVTTHAAATHHQHHHGKKKGDDVDGATTHVPRKHRQDEGGDEDGTAVTTAARHHNRGHHHKKDTPPTEAGGEDKSAAQVTPAPTQHKHKQDDTDDDDVEGEAIVAKKKKKHHRHHGRGGETTSAADTPPPLGTEEEGPTTVLNMKAAHHRHHPQQDADDDDRQGETAAPPLVTEHSSADSRLAMNINNVRPTTNASIVLASHLLLRGNDRLQKQQRRPLPLPPPIVASSEEPPITNSDGAAVLYPPSAFNTMSYDAAVTLYNDDYVKKVLPSEIEQSSNRFTDYEERNNNGILLPTAQAIDLLDRFGVQQQQATSTDVVDWCDPQDADFTSETDAACTRYLLDIRNMLSIKPMASILSTGRTIKFKIYYRHNHTQAVIKVSQKKFVLEPSSEVMAFHTDRVLGVLRVPPVAWGPVPVDFLKAASASMDAFYAQWFQKFVLDYEQVKPLKTANCFIGANNNNHDNSGSGCLNVSLQLWMADVHPADDTVVNPPRKYRAALDLIPADGDAARLLKMEDAKKSLQVASYHFAVGELANQFLFDFIIGNSDRWFGHNSFALGGCDSKTCLQTYQNKPWSKTHSTSRLAFIDQGSSFYGRSGPEMNPFTKNVGTLCRFNANTARNLLAIVPAAPAEMAAGGKTPQKPGYALYKRIKDRLPKGIFYVASSYLLKAAGSRAERVASQIRGCLSNFTESDVMYF